MDSSAISGCPLKISIYTGNSIRMANLNGNISSFIYLSIHFAMYDCVALAPISSNDHHQSAQLEQFLCFLLLLLYLVTTLLPLLTIIVVLVIVLCRVANCRRKRKRTDNYKSQCRHCCCSLSVHVCVCVC